MNYINNVSELFLPGTFSIHVVCFSEFLNINLISENIQHIKIKQILMILKHTENDSYLFDGPNNFQLSRGMEVVPLLSQKKAEISSDISTCYVGPHYAMWHSKALVYWYGMCHTVPRIKYHPSGFPSGISTTRSTQWTMKSLKIIHCTTVHNIIVKISTFWYFVTYM